MAEQHRDKHEPGTPIRSESGDPDVAPPRNPLRPANIVRAVAVALGTFYVLRLFGAAISMVLAGFLGLLFGLNLSAAADYLQRYRIPRGVSAGGIVLLVFATLAGGGALLAPALREQASSLGEQLPKAIDSLERRLQAAGITIPPPEPDDGTAAPSDSVSEGGLRQQLGKRAGAMLGLAGGLLSSAASALGGLFVVTFIAIFYAVEPSLYRDGALHLVPHARRQRVAEVLSGTSIVLRRWLMAQFLAMVFVGSLSTIAYLIIGVDAPVALGLIAGICEFVPFVGPVVAAVPAIGMAAAESADKALYVLLAAIAIQQAGEVLLIPLLMKHNLELPPILTILAQGIMGLAFGVMGVLVAVPLLVAVMVPVKMLYVEDIVGDTMDVDANGPVKREKG